MTQSFESHRGPFTISTDPARLDMNTIIDFLSRAYWAKGRPEERTEKAFDNSLVFGMYEASRQIGLARVVTDYSIFAYLCDVFIHEDYRTHGLGKWLVQSVLEHPELVSVRRWLLATNDAHGLYQQFGFKPMTEPEKWMLRLRPFPGE